MPPRATKGSSKASKKIKEPKLEDVKMSLDEMDGGEMNAREYFGRYRMSTR